ncbi:ubiquitin carboxyl-terminal hydrolase-domain-containing protein [Staphylotrichum tortipilum]|uniref:ubiquitinyl hydrolase 1 n=1 Tax=Staphylotrichum tortipilum TaxID=2831512 RepID=A0AAN6RX32_9PEZI|nr:ubiquitin carboxyl-terminal hydrolase-domain-containing protein [Staphylotrichum longicolle]
MEMMKAASSLMVPRKFRSVREKSGHRRNRSSESGAKVRPLTADSWLSIFKPDAVKQAQKEKEEEKEAAKVEIIAKRLEELNYHEISKDIIRLALRSSFANGEVIKAIELLQLQQQAFSGIIQPYDPNVDMLGAENRGNVTCYLDSLLFAMFAHLQAFESMLKNDLENESQRKLAALLRLWVNMLRSGKLIHTDMTEHIQTALAECGWKDAARLEQQDTSEAFAFIADALQLPLLALQMDLFHQGKGDVDDHKVVHERCLNLPVPPDTEGKGIKLEDCMEAYFNNKVDVLRDSLEEKKSADKLAALSPESTIHVVPEEEAEASQEPTDIPQLQRRWTTQGPVVQSPVSTSDSDPGPRARSASIIQRIVVNEKTTGSPQDPETRSLLQRAKRTGSSVVKAITIPAWQFYRLIPWNATSNSAPSSDIELARHFNQRPVVAICLKRYTMTEKGVPVRQNTFIDIPDSLRLPHFMVVDDAKEEDQDPNGLSQGYKLVLQSVICHRGDSIHSGHYVAYARVAPKLLTDNRRHDHDPPPDYEEPQWVRFDDLAIENRVQPVDDIQQCLRRQEEMPYVLIYQIVPVMDVATTSTEGSVTEPPRYVESTTDVPGTPSVETASDLGQLSKSTTSSYFESATTLASSAPPIRPSAELERPPRFSFDDEGQSLSVQTDTSRRASITFSDPVTAAPNPHPNPTPTPEAAASSPAITPQDETTGARLSRAAAKFKAGASKSRPTSQIGEGRISLTISRFGFGRPSKDGSFGAANSEASASEHGGGAEEEVMVVVGKEKEKEREHHHDKKKEKEKGEGKGKGKGKAKAAGKDGLPDRECVVM